MKTEGLIKLQNWILKVGVRISILLVLIGGSIYLFNQGLQPHVIPAIISVNQYSALELKIIEYGLYTILLVQFIRLFFVCVIFIIKRNFLFLFMSIGVLAFILFAMFAPFFDIEIFL